MRWNTRQLRCAGTFTVSNLGLITPFLMRCGLCFRLPLFLSVSDMVRFSLLRNSCLLYEAPSKGKAQTSAFLLPILWRLLLRIRLELLLGLFNHRLQLVNLRTG